jgi:hypothetical protein
MTFIKITIEAPDKLFDFKAFERTLIAGQEKLTEEAGKDFELTASTFRDRQDKPVIIIEHVRREGDTYTSAAVAVGKVYELLNWGAPPHLITPKSKRFLKFAHGSGFSPATIPGQILPWGARDDGEIVFTKSVQHPGHEARRFDLSIAAKHKDDLRPIADAAIDAGLKAAK